MNSVPKCNYYKDYNYIRNKKIYFKMYLIYLIIIFFLFTLYIEKK